MQHKTIDGELFKQLVINGAANLSVNYKEVDALNVFPVPDGDTGTNMRMTIEAGANEIKQLDSKSIYEISKKLSRGMLMGGHVVILALSYHNSLEEYIKDSKVQMEQDLMK